MARRAGWFALPSFLSLGLGLAACGPIEYVSQGREASDAIDAAREAQAEKYAPYWWTRAIQYLEKAREIAAYADFQGANRFTQLATESATKATEEAQAAAKDPAKRPVDATPPASSTTLAPAKDKL